ncbi:MAG TPA: GerMN domain-containing protein [Coriobacteriia bacterium]|nr:GerMN domain-containing protein [Coriobacteriia bacterium]
MSRFTRITIGLLAVAVSATALTGCGLRPAKDLPAPKGNVSQDTTETSVFYSTGRSLLEERKVVGSEDYYSSTLKELLRATPENNDEVAIVQPEAGFNSVTFDKKTGVVTIDWKKEILDFEAEPKEKRLAFASFLMTYGQFPEVKKVRMTVEGKDSGSMGGKDIQAFWGDVSLKKQPYAVMRPPKAPEKSETLPGAETSSPAGMPSSMP